jgi:hypothetical protein
VLEKGLSMKIAVMSSFGFKSQSCVSDKPRKTFYDSIDKFTNSGDSEHSISINGNYHSSDVFNAQNKKVIVKGNADFRVVNFSKGVRIEGSLGNADYIEASKAEIYGSANMLVGNIKKLLHVGNDLSVKRNFTGKNIIVGGNASFLNKGTIEYLEAVNNFTAEDIKFNKAVVGKDSAIRNGTFKDLSVADELFIDNTDGEKITSGGDIHIYGIKKLDSIAFVDNPKKDNNLSLVCKMPENKIKILLDKNIKKLVIWSPKGQNVLENLEFYNAEVKTKVNKRSIIDKIAEKGKWISSEEIKQLIERGIIECKRVF